MFWYIEQSLDVWTAWVGCGGCVVLVCVCAPAEAVLLISLCHGISLQLKPKFVVIVFIVMCRVMSNGNTPLFDFDHQFCCFITIVVYDNHETDPANYSKRQCHFLSKVSERIVANQLITLSGC